MIQLHEVPLPGNCHKVRMRLSMLELPYASHLVRLPRARYPTLLTLATPGAIAGVMAASPEQMFRHRLMTVLPLFLTGLASGIGAQFMNGARHSAHAYWRSVAALLLIGLTVFAIATVLVGPDTMATSPVEGIPQVVQLPIEALPLWKAGACALASVFAGVVVMTLKRSKSLA
jgi:hypothetical protein